MIKRKLANFFLNNYPDINKLYNEDLSFYLLNLFENKYIYRAKEGEIVFLAMYFMLNDEMFKVVKKNPRILGNLDFIVQACKESGNNLHFAMAVGDGEEILGCLKEVIKKEKPTSVSWFKNDLSKIHIIKNRSVLCHN